LNQKDINIPNLVTAIRVILVPFFIYLVLQPSQTSHLIAFALFVVASLTDLIDGYLARRLHQETELGKFLDPLADKCLALGAFITFIFLSEQIELWMVLCILGRDVFLTCLRYLSIYQGSSLRTSRLAKIKTAFQMFSIILILTSFSLITVPERNLINQQYHQAVEAGNSRWEVANENMMAFLAGKMSRGVFFSLASFLPYHLMMLTTLFTIISLLRYLITNYRLFLGPIPLLRPRRPRGGAGPDPGTRRRRLGMTAGDPILEESKRKQVEVGGGFQIPQKVTAALVYGRPLLVFCGMLCGLYVMWTKSPAFYTVGVAFLVISMVFDLVDGWFAARFRPHSAMAWLADRIMDKVVFSIIFPLVAVGVMWRLGGTFQGHTRGELLHAIFVLLLCVTVLIRDHFANFMRGFAIRKGQVPEPREFTRLRTVVAAPVGAFLYAYAFYVPDGPSSPIYTAVSYLGNVPIKALFMAEIILLIVNFGSIAGYCKKYGTLCLDELTLGDEGLRRRILSLFPNALTAMNAVMGLVAIFFAAQGQVREAYLMLVGAALFDKLDGALARRLGLTQPPPHREAQPRFTLGAILDDISDGVSFCLAPAYIFYVTVSPFPDPLIQGLPLAFISWAYGIMGVARLIYFTLDRSPIPGFFKGFPVPAAGLLVLAPLILFGQAIEAGSAESARFWGLMAFGLMILVAVMMNLYFIRFLHMGRFMGRRPWFTRLTVLVCLVALFTPYFGYAALISLSIYLFSPLVTWRVDPQEAAQETPLQKACDQ
jgi:CDP-diacylglycerol--glycerol-3-phosphate 3-phosphatidyltransferase